MQQSGIVNGTRQNNIERRISLAKSPRPCVVLMRCSIGYAHLFAAVAVAWLAGAHTKTFTALSNIFSIIFIFRTEIRLLI